MSRSTIIAAVAAFLSASAFAEQFVMYATGGDTDSVQRIDPILSPGSISSHVHQIFGASALNAGMTYDSLQSTDCTTVGSASGKGNAADNSVYWHPALYAQAKDGSGLIRIPTGGHKLYYQNAGNSKDKKREPFEFPHGFRMVAGTAAMRAAATDVHKQNITQWICHNSAGSNQGTDGGFPTGVKDCSAYPGFNGAIHFPHCWNGNDFNPQDPTAHMSYPEGDISAGACPSTHPTRLPHIFIENEFKVSKVVDKIKPDTFVLAQGDETGYGWHADFFNGWEDGAIPGLLASCPEAKYGNQDAGICGSFKARSKKTSDCKLPVQYVESVDSPGQSLPGCNPISNLNPAPKNAIAALGINTCAAGDSTTSAVAPPTLPTTTSTPALAISAPSAVLTTIFSLPSAYGNPTTLMTLTRSSSSEAISSESTTSASPAESTSTSQSASPSTVSCPASNGQIYTSNGLQFEVECGVDHVGGNLGMKWVNGGLQECINKCAQTQGCVDVSLSGTACYLKKSLGAKQSNAGVNGAKLVSATTASTSAQASPKWPESGKQGQNNYVFVTEVQTVTAQATAYAWS